MNNNDPLIIGIGHIKIVFAFFIVWGFVLVFTGMAEQDDYEIKSEIDDIKEESKIVPKYECYDETVIHPKEKEGIQTWRTYDELFQKRTGKIPHGIITIYLHCPNGYEINCTTILIAEVCEIK